VDNISLETKFTPEQMAKARRYRDSIRDDDEDWKLLDELEAELGKATYDLWDLVDNEPISRNSAWTPALIQKAKRVSELRPLTSPTNPGASEARAELESLRDELQALLGARSANELLEWRIQQEKKFAEVRAEMGNDLADFYELMVCHGETTAFGLCALSGLSQPTVWRRIQTLKQRELVKELPPVQTRWVAVCE